jgi:hypothetical protein
VEVEIKECQTNSLKTGIEMLVEDGSLVEVFEHVVGSSHSRNIVRIEGLEGLFL